MGSITLKTWEQRAAEKRESCAALLPASWRLPKEALSALQTPLELSKNNLISLDIIRTSAVLSPRELEITEKLDVTSLLEHLASGTYTAVEVTTAFSKRAAIAQQLVVPPSPVTWSPGCR